MKNEKGKDIAIGVLVVIIIVLAGLILLISIGKVNFNFKAVNNDDTKQEANVDNDKINDNKNNENKILTTEEAIFMGSMLYDKATEIYATSLFVPYCGYDYQSKPKGSDIANNSGEYYSTDFTSIDELKDFLSRYLSEDIVKEKVSDDVVTDLSKVEPYTNYIFYNNKLYCRGHVGKGWVSSYLDKYDISVKNKDENRITYNIVSYYAKDVDSSQCATSLNYWQCSEEERITKTTEFVIEKSNDNWVVSSFVLHE